MLTSLHHKKEVCLSFFRKQLKGKEFKTILYPLPNVLCPEKMKASFKKLAENADHLMKADKRSFHKVN